MIRRAPVFSERDRTRYREMRYRGTLGRRMRVGATGGITPHGIEALRIVFPPVSLSSAQKTGFLFATHSAFGAKVKPSLLMFGIVLGRP